MCDWIDIHFHKVSARILHFRSLSSSCSWHFCDFVCILPKFLDYTSLLLNKTVCLIWPKRCALKFHAEWWHYHAEIFIFRPCYDRTTLLGFCKFLTVFWMSVQVFCPELYVCFCLWNSARLSCLCCEFAHVFHIIMLHFVCKIAHYVVCVCLCVWHFACCFRCWVKFTHVVFTTMSNDSFFDFLQWLTEEIIKRCPKHNQNFKKNIARFTDFNIKNYGEISIVWRFWK